MEGNSHWPKAIFYDSKNTLFDWSKVWIETSSNIVNHYKSKIDGGEFKMTWHKFLVMVNHRVAFGQYQDFSETLRESLVYAFRYHSIPGSPDDVKFMLEKWNEVKPFPDTISALRKQQEKTKVLIFSNVEKKYLSMMVSKMDNFKPDFIGDMQDINACKPSPRAYFWVLKQVNLKIEDVLYCARPQWDVQGAIACGMKTAWLNRAQEKLEGVTPHYEVKDLHGITKLIQ